MKRFLGIGGRAPRASRPTLPRALAAFVAVGVGFAILAAEAPASPPVVLSPTKVGTLDRYPADVAKKTGIDLANHPTGPNGSAIVSREMDRMYQVWNIENDPKLPRGILIAERHLGTLELGRYAIVPEVRASTIDPNSQAVQFVSTIDTKNHRLFLEYWGVFVLNTLGRPTEGAERAGVISVDLRTFEVRRKAYPRALYEGQPPANQPSNVQAMEYDELTDTLVLLKAGLESSVAGTVNGLALIGWPGSTFDSDGDLALPGSGMLGPRYLRSCRRDPVNPDGIHIMAPIMITRQPDLEGDGQKKDWLLVPCYTSPQSANISIVRLALATALDPKATEERAIPAPAAVVNWAKDEVHGRLFLLNNADESAAWVYEVATNAFIGIIQMTPQGERLADKIALGVDPASGRLFGFGGSNGLMISEAAQDPVPQADVYPDLFAPSFPGRIAVDSARNRVFVVRAGAEDWHEYEIYAVPPPPPAVEPLDPDSLTQQVDEEPGKTTRDFGGNASAYGTRMLFARGFAGAIPTNGNENFGAVLRDLNTRCGFPDRDIAFAAIPTTTMGESVRFAEAHAVRIDQASFQDLNRPSRCDVYNDLDTQGTANVFLPAVTDALRQLQFPSLFETLDRTVNAGTIEPTTPSDQRSKTWGDAVDKHVTPHSKWEYRPADCRTPEDRTGANSARFAGPTGVDCKKDDSVSAEAEARAFEADLPGGIKLKIGRSWTSTTVRLDPELGLVAEARSVVENIVIGSVTIGFIENRAVAAARGRMGTAFTEAYEPVVGAVRAATFSSCQVRCDIDALIPHLNNAFAGRLEFRKPRPEPRLQEGSPGGYEAAIIKSEKQLSSDNSLVGDKSREVPALELLVLNDNPFIGRARQVLQFAGVRADSHYGIQVFDVGIPPCFDCGLPPLPPPPVVGPVRYIQVPAPAAPPLPPVIRYIPKVIGAAAYGFRLIASNPKEAGLLATAWGLLLAPFVVARRRRLLRQLRSP